MQESLFTLSEIQIKYNPKVPTLQRPRITNSQDANNQLRLLMDEKQLNIREESAVLFLNRGNRVIGGFKVSSRGLTGTVMDIRLILAVALKCLATEIVIAHTHPSGQLVPSQADKELTNRFKTAAECMDIRVYDHLIITEDSYFSFADDGIL
jgi:DNA repair protein RadC